MFKKYRKFLVALAGALAEIVSLGVLHGTAETVALAVLAALTATGVYGVRNAPAVPNAEA
jgi:hypothetical protein